jgi:hypothetical protein
MSGATGESLGVLRTWPDVLGTAWLLAWALSGFGISARQPPVSGRVIDRDHGKLGLRLAIQPGELLHPRRALGVRSGSRRGGRVGLI